MTTRDTEPTEPVFAECTTEHVFAEISSQVTTPDVRTLWARVQKEIERHGVGASATYIRGEFTRLSEEFTRELTNATVT